MHECAAAFDFHSDAWHKACRRGDLQSRKPRLAGGRRYDWAAIQTYYDEGHTYRECKAKFGFGRDTWGYAVRRGDLTAKGRKLPLRLLLSKSRCNKTVKVRLLADGLLANVCSECGISEWRGKPLSIQMDHVNGDPYDHRLENLRMLCPNCHSQTETFGTRNWIVRRRALQEAALEM